MTRPTIHGASLSPFVRKVRVALAEKDIAYDHVQLNPFGVSDEYRKKSPLGKIPCYEEGDYTLPDSSAILGFLERRHPEPPLYPSDPYEYGRALWYEEYADSKLAAVATVPFVQRFIRAKIMKQEPDEAAVAQCLEKDLPPVLDYLEGELEGREFLAGGRFGVADIATASFFVNLAHGGETVDGARWPRLDAYLSRIHGRPSFKALVEEEKATAATF